MKETELAALPIFQGVDEAALPQLLTCLGSFEKSYQKNEVVFLEDEDIRHVGVILSGIVHMVKDDAQGHRALLTRLTEGELFGESFACGTLTKSRVSFVTVTPCQVLFLPFHKVLHTCQLTCAHHHRLIENMVALISAKNVQLMEKVSIISQKTLREKILAYLYAQAPAPFSQPFTIALSRTELADYLCADRSALTRTLSALKEEGVIDFEKNTFRLLEPA